MILQLDIISGIVLFIPLIFMIIAVVFLIFFIREYIKTKHKMFGYLIIFFITYILQNIFQFGEVINETAELITASFIMQEIFNMLVLYSLVVLLEVFERDVSFSRRQSIMTILIFTTIGGIISTPSLKVNLNDIFAVSFADNEPVGLVQLIFYVVAGIWLYLMLYRNYKSAWSEKQKKMIRRLSWGVFCSIFLPFLSYLFILLFTGVSFELLIISLLFSLIIRNVGIILIGVTFLRASKEPWLLQRQKVHFLIVYSMEGIQLYSKTFDKDFSKDRTLLLAGGFSAITTLFKEATATTGSINAILLEDKELRIINKGSFLCAILVDYTTQASEIAHENFTNEFEKTFKEALEKFQGEVSIFESADDITGKYFS